MAVGTKATGYAPPKLGPFKCGNCAHFKKGCCNQPEVVADPQMKTVEVDGEKVAKVKAKGCCNEFDPKKPPKTKDTEE